MYSIPEKRSGMWIDKLGRTIEIKHLIFNSIIISVKDPNNSFYDIKLLNEAKKKSEDLPSRIVMDESDRPYLQIEAGVPGLGPTFHLYFVVEDSNGISKIATEKAVVKDIIIKPGIGMGLYDDWEDDLGVTWALPLIDYRKK